jgi:hypothetical protein
MAPSRRLADLPVPKALQEALLAEASHLEAPPSRLVETALREYLSGLRLARLGTRAAGRASERTER